MTETIPATPGLTAEQQAATRAGPAGAFLIAAGPGTGKTFTMVHRFRWLVADGGVPADQILAVTFTDAAAAELRERLVLELDQPLEDSWIGTFHSVCARLLREHAYQVGIPREVRVLDEMAQRLLVERLQAQLRSGAEPGLDRDFDALQPDEVSDLVRAGPWFALKLKGRGISPEDFLRRALEIHSSQPVDAGAPFMVAEKEAIEVLHTIYTAYEGRLSRSGRLDFDDLILQVITALREVPEFRDGCHARFRQILVDEFQDTNRIQLELIRLLAAPAFGNVTVVGDAKQSIYGWRDAEIENIRSRFPGRRLPLTMNRRSYQQILDCATAFIRRDPDFEQEPDLVAQRGAGLRPVTLMMAGDPGREAAMVAAEIRSLLAAGRRPSELAILTYSVKMLPREFEEELRKRGIPYLTSGGSGFFDREEVKDVLALLRLVADPMDDGALVRVLQGPVVRLDDRAMYRLAARRFGLFGLRLRDCLREARHDGWPELTAAQARRVEAATNVCDELAAARDGLTVADVLNRLLDRSGYLRHIQLRSRREGRRAVMNVNKVIEMASSFERDSPLAGLPDFVTHLDRIIEINLAVGEAPPPQDAEAVRLMTIHGAKGLEFEAVFLVNVRPPRPRDLEKLFFEPESLGFVMKYWRNSKHPRFKQHAPGTSALALARQERRRAVYVALTRAKDLLYVSASRPEERVQEVDAELEADDHFAELLSWSLHNPEAARVIEAEQLPLPGADEARAGNSAEPRTEVDAVIDRLELLQASEPRSRRREARREEPDELRLSFSQLHQFDVCPVRYRYQEVWNVPAPPDELLTRPALAGLGAAEMGASVHQALAAWHTAEGRLEDLYSGPPLGLELLQRYVEHPLARARTLGCEVEFNLRLPGVRVKGLVDRVCEYGGQVTLVDYKTNASLDGPVLRSYEQQLRLYGLAAARGLLPGGDRPRLILFDMRRAEEIEVHPDPEAAEAWVLRAAGRVAAGDFALGPEHANRPCVLCAFRPLCPDRL